MELKKEDFDILSNLGFLRNKYNLNEKDIDEMAIPSYTHKNPLIRWIFKKRLTALINLSNFDGKVILDYGCGFGVLFSFFINSKRVYACDLHPQIAVQRSKDLNLKVNFIKGLKNLKDDSIEIAIFADVLEHIKDIDAFLLLLSKKLRSGSEILISLPTESFFYKICRFVAGYDSKAEYHINDFYKIKLSLDKLFSLEGEISLPLIFPLFKIYKYIKK